MLPHQPQPRMLWLGVPRLIFLFAQPLARTGWGVSLQKAWKEEGAGLFLRDAASKCPWLSLTRHQPLSTTCNCHLFLLFSTFFFFLVGCFYSFMLVPLNYSFLKEINSSEPAMEKSRVCFRHAGIFFDPKFWFV